MLKDAYEAQYFEERSADGDARQAMRIQELARLRERVQLDSGVVLDIGCGQGEFLELFGDRWQRFGIDVSRHAIELCEAKGISFDVPREEEAWCDVIVFRGSLQHLDRPIETLWDAWRWLKPGGLICFLMTPNAGAPVYRLFQWLPALTPELNFVVFSDKELRQCLTNMGFRDIEILYPYLGTPYASPARDHLRFVLRLFGVRRPFAFWRNMMECYARK